MALINNWFHWSLYSPPICLHCQSLDVGIYNDTMIQWTMITINGLHRQLVYDVERYNDTMNNDNDNDWSPIIGRRDWKQQKLRRGFKQNSAICLQTFSLQNVSRHPPSAGKTSPFLPWQNCLYKWYSIHHNWLMTYHSIDDRLKQCVVQFWTNSLHHPFWVLTHFKVNNDIAAIKIT